MEGNIKSPKSQIPAQESQTNSQNVPELILILESVADRLAELAWEMRDCPLHQEPRRYRLMEVSMELDELVTELTGFAQ